jgi:hypothetical protein
VRGVRGRYSRVYCGGGRLSRCRAMLASTLSQAVDTPADKVYGADKVCDSQPTVGPADPMRKSHNQMCWDAIWQQAASAIESPLIPWQNRPTFQQAVEIEGHRPREPKPQGCQALNNSPRVVGRDPFRLVHRAP